MSAALMEVGAPIAFGLLFAIAAVAFRKQRSASTVFLVLAVGSCVWAAILGGAHPDARWRWLLSSIPAAIVLQHAILLFVVRRRDLPTDSVRARATMSKGDEPRFLLDMLDQIQSTTERIFSIEALALRYFVPATFIFALGVGISNVLVDGTNGPVRDATAVLGARYGFIGAYTYVMLYLGKRAFHRDITVGGATWCAISMAMGPVLARGGPAR